MRCVTFKSEKVICLVTSVVEVSDILGSIDFCLMQYFELRLSCFKTKMKMYSDRSFLFFEKNRKNENIPKYVCSITASLCLCSV